MRAKERGLLVYGEKKLDFHHAIVYICAGTYNMGTQQSRGVL